MNTGNPFGEYAVACRSFRQYLRPESVRVDQISDPKNDPDDWNDPTLDFTRYSSTGVIGNPTHANAELGARLWHAVVDSVALTFKEIANAALG